MTKMFKLHHTLTALCLIFSGTAVSANLLENGDFESGTLEGWNPGGAIVSTEQVHSGTYSAKLVNQTIEALVATTPGEQYKVVGWIKLHQETGSDWGGFNISALNYNWENLASTGYLTQAGYGSGWFKVAVSFTANTTVTRIQVGYFGGPGRTITAFADDLIVRSKDANLPPVITASITPSSYNSLPSTMTYAISGDDPDGAIKRIDWDFGDGLHAQGFSGTRRVGTPGQFTARVRVSDDDGAVVERTVSWSSGDPSFPSISITNPAVAELTVNSPFYTLSGSVSGSGISLMLSSDRGYSESILPVSPWSKQISLQPGRNRITAQVRDASGKVVTQTRIIRYVPSQPLLISGLSASASQVERWKTLSITFNLENSASSTPQFPYDPAPAPGLETLDGVTVDGLFTPDDWHTVYRRPAFIYQPYQRAEKGGEEWMYPNGPAVWMVRFAPPSEGNWRYRIEAVEAKGSAVSREGSFTVTPAQPGNHGPVRVSKNDSRYFEYADGAPFLGTGHGIGASAERYSYDMAENLATIGIGNQQFFRFWVAGHFWGSAWQPWSSRTLPYEGTVPASGLSLGASYGDGYAALKLDSSNPIMFQGFMSGHAGVIPGRTYRVRIRWMTTGVSGPQNPSYPYGVCVKFTNWPEPGETNGLPILVPHSFGDTPWHISEGTFIASSDFIDNLSIILENTTGGTAYIDEIGMYEVLAGGELGPQLLRTPRFNSHLAFDQRREAGMDAILAEAESRNMAFKLVMSEKQEYLLNHLGPDGIPDPLGGHFNNGDGSPTQRLHQYYWRRLSARFGASQAVHSWELVNEEAPSPGDHFRLTAKLAEASESDGNGHPASTSTWATLAESAWKDPDSAPISSTDFHAYVRSTGWIEPREQLARDSARFMREYDLAAFNAAFGKPVVWGEQGIDGTSGSDGQDPLLSQDTSGTWMHKMIWARTGHGGVYPLYWYTDNIFAQAAHPLFGNWNRFMQGIAVNNGRYRDASAVCGNPQMRAWGQKDIQAGRAHIWIDNSNHTWRNVVDGVTISPVSGTVTVNLSVANTQFIVDRYNTSTGLVSSSENLTTNASGDLVISVSNLAADTAVRIRPASEPAIPVITDEGAYTTNGASLSASWTSSDPAAEFQYCIGTAPGASDVTGWTSVGTALSVTKTGLSLNNTSLYFFSVRARLTNGLWSEPGTSDGIRYALPVASIAAAKLRGDGEAVSIASALVSSRLPDAIYIQDPARSCGIRCAGAAASEGSTVSVIGVLDTVNGEKTITEPVVQETPGSAPKPLETINRSLMNSGWFYDPYSRAGQAAIGDGDGLPVTGLLVRVRGVVIHDESLPPNRFKVSDGSVGGLIVEVPAGVTKPSTGSFVLVTGAASCFEDTGGLQPRLLVRRQSDIAVQQ